ncbi:hypothetical protein C7S20_05685 [Christiangramia fulva]|uniref:Uncharacterized protein n=1 Tax=Christiangramia fulva TaxID=2126553 RepID=A0A2R3Z3G6_9FLAO|nr:hypothetical protein [Christiangramia fulva]AVR44799.1 hypothetical protein C7S20_05685 [Christiangramia fulva]
MRIKPQIKASFLLGIFLLMSFHQVIPHAHHDHISKEKQVAHHHHGDENHHHHKKQEKEQEGFLSYLLALHSHGSGTSEIPVLKEHSETFSFKKVENKKLNLEGQYAVFAFLSDEQYTSSEFYRPPRKYFNPYLSFLSLRGPPALG